MSHCCLVEISTDKMLGACLPAHAAAVAVNGSLLENTSVASDEGGTFAAAARILRVALWN